MCVRIRNHWYCYACRGNGVELHHSCKARFHKRHQKVREWRGRKNSFYKEEGGEAVKRNRRRGAVLVEYLLLALGSMSMAYATLSAIQEAHAALLGQIRSQLGAFFP